MQLPNQQTTQGIYMKALIILSLTIISLNAFSAEVGEDKKSECPYSPQSSRKAEPKISADNTAKEVVKETKTSAK